MRDYEGECDRCGTSCGRQHQSVYRVTPINGNIICGECDPSLGRITRSCEQLRERFTRKGMIK